MGATKKRGRRLTRDAPTPFVRDFVPKAQVLWDEWGITNEDDERRFMRRGDNVMGRAALREAVKKKSVATVANIVGCSPSHVRKLAGPSGRIPTGHVKQRAMLAPGQVAEVRRRHAAGERCAELAREFDISRQAMHKILKGVSYRNITDSGEINLNVPAKRKKSKKT